MVQKVVINKCFGGFGLSDEAQHALAARKGVTLYELDESFGSKSYATVPKEEVDRFVGMVFANELMAKGYRRTSSAYCISSRIDREDWLDFLARKLNCARADFYKMDGTGIDDRWRDQHIRCYSKDQVILHPSVSIYMRTY